MSWEVKSPFFSMESGGRERESDKTSVSCMKSLSDGEAHVLKYVLLLILSAAVQYAA